MSLVQLLAHTFKRLLKKDIDEINQGFISDPVKTLPVLVVRVILTSKVLLASQAPRFYGNTDSPWLSRKQMNNKHK